MWRRLCATWLESRNNHEYNNEPIVSRSKFISYQKINLVPWGLILLPIKINLKKFSYRSRKGEEGEKKIPGRKRLIPPVSFSNSIYPR